MYAVHLPELLPPAGSPGGPPRGPPLPAAFREFAGAPFDTRVFFLYYIHHPEKLPRTNKEAGDTFSPENRANIGEPSAVQSEVGRAFSSDCLKSTFGAAPSLALI